jgi:hypothetical protein
MTSPDQGLSSPPAVPEVVINGIRYAPADTTTSRIGVAITTRNRNDILERTRKEHLKHLPPGAKLVVVDDASATPVPDADYRFEKNAGIARAKNKCLELLAEAGCQHLFLFDDDAYPIADDWWQTYVDSPEPHLMAVYEQPTSGHNSEIEILYRDEQHIACHATRGYMLYVERRVLDAVGGMDPAFGRWGWEHVSWSDRIHSAGLTTWRYADVRGSQNLIHSMDQHEEIASTVDGKARAFAAGPGLEHRMAKRHSPEYIEYRDLDDVVLTVLLTARKDPQRGRALKAEPSLLSELHDSLKHDGRFVVLHTALDDAGKLPRAELHQVPQQINPYFERWVAVYRWLRAHPEVGRVWCVDGTDVRMLRDPFDEMEPDTIYTGYEPSTLRSKWMLDHHPDKNLQEFMKGSPNLPLLNAGLLGGSREDVMGFAHAMVKMWFDDHIDWIMGWEKGRVCDASSGDMAVFNYVARTFFGDRVSTGPHVCTVFKAFEKDNTTAWYAHK